MADHSSTNYSNIYLDTAQGAYTGRYDNLSYPTQLNNPNADPTKSILIDYGTPATNGKPDSTYKNGIDNGHPDYTQKLADTGKVIYGKDASGNSVVVSNNGKLYLQPDNPLMSNNDTGFNAYVVSNTSTITKDSHVFFAVRGSDGFGDLNKGVDGLNAHNIKTDWLSNDFEFTLNDSRIPQVDDAKAALQNQIDHLPPGTTIDVSGHSLGTIVSIETVAALDPGYVNSIGHVVLFDGPDARNAINNMGAQAKANIAALEKAGKIDYYVNAFDFVSMLNRNNGNEIGNVHYIIPKDYNSTFADPSGHDTYELSYKMDKYGNPIPANRKDNPDIFAYGDMVSTFERETISDLKSILPSNQDRSSMLRLIGYFAGQPALLKKLLDKNTPVQDKVALVTAFMSQMGINVDVEWAAKHISDLMGIGNNLNNLMNMYPSQISNLQNQIKGASGGKKISLRKELVDEVAKAGNAAGSAYAKQVEELLSEAKQQVEDKKKEAINSAYSVVAGTLSRSEVEAMFSGSGIEEFWDSGQEADDKKAGNDYKDKLDNFGDALTLVASELQEFDKSAAKNFFSQFSIQKS